MKKLQILLAALTICTAANAAQLELKAGFEPFREGKSGYADFDRGASIGAEALFNCEDKPFDYGFGIERKSHFKGDSRSSNDLSGVNAYPIYLTGKSFVYDDLFYVVGRVGWAMYENSGAEDGLYAGLGIGKQYGNITLEGMYEHFDVNTSSKLYSADQAGVFSLKVGYRFGENRRDVIAREKEEAARLEQERYQAEEARLAAEKEAKEKEEAARLLAEEEALRAEETARAAAREEVLEKYSSITLSASYGVNELTTSELDSGLMDKINTDLADEAGVIEVKAYTDSKGSEGYNKKLSQDRADRVADAIREKLTNENIEVKAEGLGETNFLNDNSTAELRRANRRVEIKFIAE